MKSCTRLLFVFVFFLVASCDKKKNEVPPSSSYFQIALDTPMVTGNKVLLKWSGIESRYITSIRIERASDSEKSTQFQTIVRSPNDTQYTDTLTLTSYVTYRVVAQVTTSDGSKTVYSNSRVFARSDIDFLTFRIKDAICDKQTGRIYMTGTDGELGVYDIATRKVLRKIETGATITHLTMATHNGRNELYLSRNDGWVFVYDPETLDKTDQLNVMIVPTSLVCNNGKIFVSSSSSVPSLVTYDRTSKALLFDTAYSFSGLSLLALPGTNTVLLGLSSFRYRMGFNADGVMTSARANNSASFFAYAPFALLPGNTSVVCANMGVILDTGFNYISTLPRGNVFLRSFDVDVANSRLYCATSGKEVHVYNTGTFMQEKRINTAGFPIRAFYYNGTVYCISSEYDYYSSSENMFIERL